MDYQFIKALEETIEEINGWGDVRGYEPTCVKDALRILCNKLKKEKRT